MIRTSWEGMAGESISGTRAAAPWRVASWGANCPWPAKRPVRVLVVDDHADVRFLVRAILGDAGPDVACAREARPSASRGRGRAEPARDRDVVVLDARMPAWTASRSPAMLLDRRPGLPILLCTASWSTSPPRARARPASACISKDPLRGDPRAKALHASAGQARVAAPASARDDLLERHDAAQAAVARRPPSARRARAAARSRAAPRAARRRAPGRPRRRSTSSRTGGRSPASRRAARRLAVGEPGEAPVAPRRPRTTASPGSAGSSPRRRASAGRSAGIVTGSASMMSATVTPSSRVGERRLERSPRAPTAEQPAEHRRTRAVAARSPST